MTTAYGDKMDGEIVTHGELGHSRETLDVDSADSVDGVDSVDSVDSIA